MFRALVWHAAYPCFVTSLAFLQSLVVVQLAVVQPGLTAQQFRLLSATVTKLTTLRFVARTVGGFSAWTLKSLVGGARTHCLLFATQLVSAGVDFPEESVFRPTPVFFAGGGACWGSACSVFCLSPFCATLVPTFQSLLSSGLLASLTCPFSSFDVVSAAFLLCRGSSCLVAAVVFALPVQLVASLCTCWLTSTVVKKKKNTRKKSVQ